ncbi:MAG: hypothetical protein P857_168 [Candidatus Xenolissoclinum pacificiensis L6]|uniref:Uncharacterized protein n=1 Tax=Candidatus Xenolissoclinum pacificiensis L6 TaxID=1401685 RepID=W2V076_9RICK|nr:MAG: hypothetical protein P857_168 [Candidatus Xenolissoclinum pacificiensis L6]
MRLVILYTLYTNVDWENLLPDTDISVVYLKYTDLHSYNSMIHKYYLQDSIIVIDIKEPDIVEEILLNTSYSPVIIGNDVIDITRYSIKIYTVFFSVISKQHIAIYANQHIEMNQQVPFQRSSIMCNTKDQFLAITIIYESVLFFVTQIILRVRNFFTCIGMSFEDSLIQEIKLYSETIKHEAIYDVKQYMMVSSIVNKLYNESVQLVHNKIVVDKVFIMAFSDLKSYLEKNPSLDKVMNLSYSYLTTLVAISNKMMSLPVLKNGIIASVLNGYGR